MKKSMFKLILKTFLPFDEISFLKFIILKDDKILFFIETNGIVTLEYFFKISIFFSQIEHHLNH